MYAHNNTQKNWNCTLFAVLRGQDTAGTMTWIIDCFENPKTSLLKSSHSKKYLPNFPSQKNPRIKNLKPPKNPSIFFWNLEDPSPPPSPPPGQSQSILRSQFEIHGTLTVMSHGIFTRAQSVMNQYFVWFSQPIIYHWWITGILVETMDCIKQILVYLLTYFFTTRHA